jgi:hypothetical protein
MHTFNHYCIIYVSIKRFILHDKYYIPVTNLSECLFKEAKKHEDIGKLNWSFHSLACYGFNYKAIGN